MFSNDRNEIRNVFFLAWRKHREQTPLTPLENQLVSIMLAHPEYHTLLENPQIFQQEDFAEENPFLHMGLHLSLREQVSTDRPGGIKRIYESLCTASGNIMLTEHRMMECLAAVLWKAQETAQLPDEQTYLELLKQL